MRNRQDVVAHEGRVEHRHLVKETTWNMQDNQSRKFEMLPHSREPLNWSKQGKSNPKNIAALVHWQIL